MKRPLVLGLAVLALPSVVSAQVISQVSGLFNIMVGLMLVVAILMFFGGLGMWFSRLGTYPSYRDEAINLMTWAVVVLFVLSVLLAFVQFVQSHTATAYFLLGIVVVIAVAYLIVKLSQQSGKGDDDH